MAATRSDTAARRSLRSLVDRLAPAAVDLVAAPRGLDIPIRDLVILDPAEPQADLSGSVVLAVGVEGDRARVALLQRLVDAGAAAVVVKSPPNAGGADAVSAEVKHAADDTGVALLTAPAPMSWGQLFTLLSTAAAGVPNEDSADDAVPLADLFALANAVAAMVGGATTIEDPHNQVLAYSNLDHPVDLPRQRTILGRQVPGAWIQWLQDSGVFRQLWASDQVVRVPEFSIEDSAARARLAVAVRAGGELLGSLWVVEGEHPLDAEAERALREAAEIAALHLLRHRTAADVDRRRRTEALTAVLDGSSSGERAADILGLDSGESVSVVAFDVAADDEAHRVVAAGRVADLVAMYCESYRRQAACAAQGGRAYVLLPVEPDSDERQVTLAEAIVQRASQSLRLGLRAGVGSIVSGIGQAPVSRRDADDVLDVLLGTDDRQSVAAISSIRERVVLHRLRRIAAAHPELTEGRVGALAEQDAAKGASWVPTLRAYFDAFGDMAAAAALVNVHPNTFRYRLRRITEIFDLDLGDPDVRLVAELQLRFLGDRS